MHRLATLFPFADKLTALKDYFIALGPAGAFLLALVDSFVPLPGGADLAVVALTVRQPSIAVVAVACATIGAAIGATVLYLGARGVGVAAFKGVSEERRARIENLLGRYDVLAIVVAAILPPPFPFKLFNIGAGAFNVKPVRFVIAIVLGRGLRFSVEAALAVKYGDQALDVLKEHGLAILAVVVVLGVAFGVWRLVASRRAGADQPGPPPASAD